MESDKGVLMQGIQGCVNQWRIAEGFLETSGELIAANVCFEVLCLAGAWKGKGRGYGMVKNILEYFESE